MTDPVTGTDFVIDEDADLSEAAMEFTPLEQVPTELHVEFRDRDKDDEDDSEPIPLPDPQPGTRVEQRIELPSVKRRSQAARYGELALRQLRRFRRVVTCTGTVGRGLRLLQLEPGDIVRVTSERLGLSSDLFRVFVVGWSSDMRPGLVLVQHDPAAYSEAAAAFRGPNSATQPGERPPPKEEVALQPAQLSVKTILGGHLHRRGDPATHG